MITKEEIVDYIDNNSGGLHPIDPNNLACLTRNLWVYNKGKEIGLFNGSRTPTRREYVIQNIIALLYEGASFSEIYDQSRIAAEEIEKQLGVYSALRTTEQRAGHAYAALELLLSYLPKSKEPSRR